MEWPKKNGQTTSILGALRASRNFLLAMMILRRALNVERSSKRIKILSCSRA